MPSRNAGSATETIVDFAERGAIALPAQDKGSVGTLESPFEEAVAAELERLGWSLVPQVGISGFRVDIGVRHPDFAGTYLAGVECDGATYHSSATARDRDKVREQVLRGLGWEIVRVWSTDWWFNRAGCAERLHASLTALLESSRRKRMERPAVALVQATTYWDGGPRIDPIGTSATPLANAFDAERQPQLLNAEPPILPVAPAIEAAPVVMAQAESQSLLTALYRITDL